MGAEGQGLLLAMGASPHTPIMGIMGMGEHVLPDRLADNIARGTEGFRISFIRMQELFFIG